MCIRDRWGTCSKRCGRREPLAGFGSSPKSAQWARRLSRQPLTPMTITAAMARTTTMIMSKSSSIFGPQTRIASTSSIVLGAPFAAGRCPKICGAWAVGTVVLHATDHAGRIRHRENRIDKCVSDPRPWPPAVAWKVLTHVLTPGCPSRCGRTDADAENSAYQAVRLMGRVGLEPTTMGLKVPCSTN